MMTPRAEAPPREAGNDMETFVNDFVVVATPARKPASLGIHVGDQFLVRDVHGGHIWFELRGFRTNHRGRTDYRGRVQSVSGVEGVQNGDYLIVLAREVYGVVPRAAAIRRITDTPSDMLRMRDADWTPVREHRMNVNVGTSEIVDHVSVDVSGELNDAEVDRLIGALMSFRKRR